MSPRSYAYIFSSPIDGTTRNDRRLQEPMLRLTGVALLLSHRRRELSVIRLPSAVGQSPSPFCSHLGLSHTCPSSPIAYKRTQLQLPKKPGLLVKIFCLMTNKHECDRQGADGLLHTGLKASPNVDCLMELCSLHMVSASSVWDSLPVYAESGTFSGPKYSYGMQSHGSCKRVGDASNLDAAYLQKIWQLTWQASQQSPLDSRGL